MLVPDLIPSPDPNALPAPYWVFKFLLLVTFVLHIVAMNAILGGSILALVGKWGSKDVKAGNRIFFDVAKKLPVLLPATITLGVAPLLFVQVIYGQFFYTSSVIMAWPWLFVLVFITIAYYGYYYVSFRSGRDATSPTGGILLVSTILIAAVGFIYCNNFTLSQTPSRWAQKYFADPSGWSLNLSEPTLIPRYLHFVTAAIAVGGLLLILIAYSKWKSDLEYSRSVFRLGGKAFLYASMAQFVIGTWFLVSLPRTLRMTFMGDNVLGTAIMMAGIVLALAAIFLMSEAMRKEDVRLGLWIIGGLSIAVIACMAVMRDLLRDAYLQQYFRPEQFPTQTQWSVFPLFLALFVGGVVLWIVMLARYRSALHGKTGERKSSPEGQEMRHV